MKLSVLVGALLVLCSVILVSLTLYYSTSPNEKFMEFLRVYVTIVNIIIAFIIAWIGVSTIIASKAFQDTP